MPNPNECVLLEGGTPLFFNGAVIWANANVCFVLSQLKSQLPDRAVSERLSLKSPQTFVLLELAF